MRDGLADAPSTDLLARWRSGSQEAARELFRRYADRLIALARSRLSAKVSRRIDPEDVVQSAYRSFFAGARDGRFDVRRGGDLWQLMVVITLNKLRDQVKRHTRGKRSVRAEQGLGCDPLRGVDEELAGAPSPLAAVALADQMEQVMGRLAPLERRMLELRLQGHTLDEIAAAVQLSRTSVYRVLERVKQMLEEWERDAPP